MRDRDASSVSHGLVALSESRVDLKEVIFDAIDQCALLLTRSSKTRPCNCRSTCICKR
ncbi:MAG: hypothetical protein JWR22_2931 [Herminiimonas sp.]|nr:hypothetical protein [Herminiimonas sp.]